MIFVDYYKILEITPAVTPEEIILAFRNQAKKWHPDKNPALDTTQRMQLINEAFLILKDTEARAIYDAEYRLYKKQFPHYSPKTEQENNKERYQQKEYVTQDEILKKWMANARKQAVDLARETIEDIRKMGGVGANAAGKEMGNYAIYLIITSIVLLIIFAIQSSNKKEDNYSPTNTADYVPIAQIQSTPKFTSLYDDSLFRYLFKPEYFNQIHQAVWKPDSNEAKIFPISSDGYCYTELDTAHFFYDTLNNKEKAVLVYATFKKDNNGKREECHVCAPYISVVVLTKHSSTWELEQIHKQFGNHGSWGQTHPSSVSQYGSGKYYIEFLSYYSGQGYLERSISHYDINSTNIIFFLQPETISNLGVTSDEDKAYNYDIETQYLPNGKDIWSLRVKRLGLMPSDDQTKVIPVNYYEEFEFEYTTKQYVKKETVNRFNENVFFISNLGIITIPKEIEVQSIDYQRGKPSSDFIETSQIIPNNNNKIVLQQFGLNSANNKSFDTYVRFIIETVQDGDFEYNEEDFILTSLELQQIDDNFRKQIMESYNQDAIRIIDWYGTTVEKINNRNVFKISFLRQLEDHPSVNVEMYYFFMHDKMCLVTLSYQTRGKDKWQPILREMLYSLYFIVHPFHGE